MLHINFDQFRLLRCSFLKVWMIDDDGRITEDNHTVISLCEPSVQVSLRHVAFSVTFIIFNLSKLTSINQTIQYIEHEKDQRKHYPGGFINFTDAVASFLG